MFEKTDFYVLNKLHKHSNLSSLINILIVIFMVEIYPYLSDVLTLLPEVF